MNWTDNQTAAIEEKDKNLLVSAAAGSGKTAVLVERIIRLIIEDGVDIDRFLVVTFTKAAAAEMKEKLIRAIRKQISTEQDTEKRRRLKRQLDRMYLASISTFHSFAINVVKRFFQYAEVDPGVRVLDDGEADILLYDAAEEVFLKLFEEHDEAFLRFLDRHSSNGGEESLKKSLIADYRKLRSIPHYFDWLSEAAYKLSLPVNEALAGEPLMRLKSMYTEALSKSETHLIDLIDLLETNGVGTFASSFREQLADVQNMLRACREQEDFRDSIHELSSISLAKKHLKKEEIESFEQIKPDVQELQKSARDPVKDLLAKYARHTDAEETAMMQQAYADLCVYQTIMHRLEDAFTAAKQERRGIDYGDIEHYAIKVLSHEDAASIYRGQFDYIFIDEYQDSNYLQEEIIGRIAREDDLFMVGDVKQSIYRFRMAEPDIFLEKYRMYDSQDAVSEKIDLNDNFRSKAGVIGAVNHIFRSLMPDYDDNAALKQGAPDEQDIDYPVEMHLIDRTNAAYDDLEEVDEELFSMKWQEKEAHNTVRLIKESLGQPFYDTKAGIVRGFEQRDMVILMRSIKQAGPIYKDIFHQAGIGVFVEDTSSFFETIEIMTFLDLLQLLNNPQRDLALLSVLRSFFFDFSINDLIRIRMHDKTIPFHEAFEQYAALGEDEGLRKRCKKAGESLDAWRKLSTYLPLDELIARLLHDTGYYALMGAVPGGEQRQANLRSLADRAHSLMEMGSTRIQDLLRYVKALQERGDVDVGQTSLLGENDNVVRIMTIHKSKGLEFPLVFVNGLGAGASRGGAKGFASIDRSMGIAIPFADEKRRYKDDLLLRTLIREKQAEQEEDESKRVLYVALTRAKDKLVMSAAVDPEKPYNSYYYKMLKDILSASSSPILITWDPPYTGSREGQAGTSKTTTDAVLSEYLTARDNDMKEKVGTLLGAVYPYKDELTAKSKYSVTELNRHDEQQPPVIRLPRFLEPSGSGTEKEENEKPLFGALLGTILHTVMEHLPLGILGKTAAAVREDPGSREKEDALKSAISAYLDELTEKEILTAREKESVDPAMIERFLLSGAGERLLKAKQIHRETPFTYTFRMDGRDTLVQGIIDLWIEEDDGIVLFDYKSNMKTEGIREIYQKQIDLYKEALEGLTGMRVKESYLYLLREGRLVSMQ